MRSLILAVALGLTAPVAAIAAPDEAADDDGEYLNEAEYNALVDEIGVVLAKAATLEGDDRVRVERFLAQTIVAVYATAAEAHMGGDIEQGREDVERFMKMMRKAAKRPTTKWAKILKPKDRDAFEDMVERGYDFLRKGLSAPIDSIESKTALKAVEALGDLMARLLDQDHEGFDLQARLKLAKGDSDGAYEGLAKAWQIYVDNPEDNEADLEVGEIALAAAHIARDSKSDMDAALAWAQRGRQQLAVEYGQLAQPTSLETEEFESLADELRVHELNTWRAHTARHEEARAVFEAEAKANPEDYLVQVGLADVMRNWNADKAMSHYDNAVKIDPEKAEAHVGRGNIYYDRAQLMGIETPEGKENYEEAFDALEYANQLDPSNNWVIRSLLDICKVLGMDDAYSRYRSMLDARLGN